MGLFGGKSKSGPAAKPAAGGGRKPPGKPPGAKPAAGVKPAAKPAVKSAPVPAAKPASSSRFFGFLRDAPVGDKLLVNPEQDERRLRLLGKRLNRQGIMIILLIVTFVIAEPFLRTRQIYFARRIGEVTGYDFLLNGLDVPILTQAAILSWATTTVTEVMTYHFANYNQRISSFSNRFTTEGWNMFVEALLDAATIKKFKEQSLVLTAAPVGQAVIVHEGVNPKTLQYEWIIQLPILLNYATNNDKSVKARSTVQLTAVRTSTLENPYGIAIKKWRAK